jgi:hypothetical protein
MMDKKIFNFKISLDELKELSVDEEYEKFLQEYQMSHHHKYVYKCSWFETKRHKLPYTKIYYEKAEHTHWIFNSLMYQDGLIKVEYIKVCPHSYEYKLAVCNSKIKNDNKDDNKDDNKPLNNDIVLDKC